MAKDFESREDGGRRVVAGLFISVDGVTESPDQWQFDHFDEGMMEHLAWVIDNEDAVLLGRVTYQEWADHWPESDVEPYASHINSIPKYVVSRTLNEVNWANASLLGSDLAGEVARLKQQPGGNIGVAGSPTLVRSLIEEDLLDELILMVHPVIAGSGRQLFTGDMAPKRLDLARSTRTATGVAIQTYARRDG
jgi:dihydrofolate reductase